MDTLQVPPKPAAEQVKHQIPLQAEPSQMSLWSVKGWDQRKEILEASSSILGMLCEQKGHGLPHNSQSIVRFL